jgi:threonine dehydratase
VIPFRSDLIHDPVFLHIDFPERIGALRDLMREVSAFAGICYFNYAESGTEEGQALIGFQCADRLRLLSALERLQYPYHEIEMGDLLGRQSN